MREGIVRASVRLLLGLCAVGALLTGCATPDAQIRRGNASLLPQSVSANFHGVVLYIDTLVEIRGQRHDVSVLEHDCEAGIGELHVDHDYIYSVQHVLISGDKPEDRLFKEICETGMPLAQLKILEIREHPERDPRHLIDELWKKMH